MSKSSPPVPNLRQRGPPAFIALDILRLLVFILLGVYILAFFLLGPGVLAQPMQIEISFRTIFLSTVLTISMMVPFVTSIVSGYRCNTIQVFNGQEKEQWAVGLEAAFKTFALKAYPFKMQHPEHTEKFARSSMMAFARYLANPYHTGPLCLSQFSKRRLINVIVPSLLLALNFASLPFRAWFEQDGTPSKGVETFIQGLGCVLVVWWCYYIWEHMWTEGWALKMGDIARQIRRECIKNGSVKGSEEDIEKSGAIVDPKERLEWWIQEIWKVCGDGHDIPQSELSQLEENREKLCEEQILIPI